MHLTLRTKTAWLVAIAALTGLAVCNETLASPKQYFPLARVFPDPVPIVFPGFNMAAAANPAALPTAGSGASVQAGYQVGLDSQPNRSFLSAARSRNNFGVSAGYVGDIENSLHGAFLGAGAKFKTFSIGMALRDFDLQSGFSPHVDIGLNADLKSLRVAMVMYRLDGQPQLGVGIGSQSGHRFALEGNVLLPPFDALDGSYRISVMANLGVELLRVYFGSSYTTGSSSFSHSVGLGAEISKSIALLAQYNTDRSASGGVTVSF